MDTWRSDTDDGEVIDLLSVDDYDAYKAKVQASLSWVLHKAYEDQIPQEFTNPFYERGEGSWQIKPRLANLLANSELYCQACRNMFGENASQWQGHWSIIQVLSRKGIYAVGTDSTDVTETILMQTSPFKIKAHIALIDALMLAFSREIITIERVTQCVRRFTSFNASSELPSDLEDAILFWINKVCVTVQQNLDKIQTGPDESDTSPKDPMTTLRDGVSVPVMENFMSDVGDGCCLAALLSFYCPQTVKLEDVYLKSVVGIADSLYNLRLIRSFCDKYIPNKTCHFTYEDMLYSKEPLKENFLVMVSELFYWFEIRPLSVVTGGGKVAQPVSGEGDGQRPVFTGKQQSFTSVSVPSVPISSKTKQSFQRLKGDSELRSSSTPDIHKLSPSAPLLHRVPLLQKRHQSSLRDDHSLHKHSASVHRAHSLTSKDLKTGSIPRESVLAWQDRGPPDVAQMQEISADTNLSGSNLLANVSIDSEMNASFSSGSIDLGDLEPTPRTDRTDQTYTKQTPDNVIQFSLQNQQQMPQDFAKQQTAYYPGDLNIESVTSERSDVHSQVSGSKELQRGDNSYETVEESDSRGVNLHVEPLMPARLKPLKEKSNIHTKEEERGDDFPKRKVPSPPRLKKGVEFNPEIETINRSPEISRSDSTVSNGQITPLPEDLISPRDNFTPDPQSRYVNNQGFDNTAGKSAPKKFEAFFIRGSLTESQDTSIASHRGELDDAFVKESFSIPDQIHTPEAARAAGIPIIDSSEHPFVRQTSREGSISSSRSSGDFSDHESRKIHFDHKTRESSKTEPVYMQESSHVNIKSPGQYIIQKPVIVNKRKDEDKNIKTNATNFAEIKHLKELGNVDNSGLIYMQDGQEKEGQKSPLKEALKKNKTEKKTTFAPLPNQRTWQQSLATANQNQESSEPSQSGTASQELLKIKLKLEEKRKAIERKKHTQEIQQQKMRQRLGKAAFMHVIAKPKEEDEKEDYTYGRPTSLAPARMSTSDPEVQVESKATKATERNAMNISDSSTKQVTPRRFSRDDIQQTIENVKTKWFNGDDSVSSRIQDEEFSQRRTESPASSSRTQRSLSVENREPEISQRISPKREPDEEKPDETYEEYNTSLDKLNQSLTDLQGEIMKLSLKQKQSGQPVDNEVNNETVRQNRNDNSVNTTKRSLSPPNVLEVKSKEKSHREAEPGRPRGAQLRSSSEPRQIVSQQIQEEQIGNYQSHTLPRHPTYQHNQVSPYMMQGHVSVAGPAGPVYSNPNQFVPVPGGSGMVPTPQQYGSYLMGPTHPQQIGQIPPQQITPPYQQSPPHLYPQTVPMYGQPFAQQNIISPLSQPYPTMYPTQPQPQYQPHPHITSTYTTPSHPQHAPYTQPMTVTQQPEPVVNGTIYTQVQNRVPTSNQTVSQDSYKESKVSSARKEPDSSKNATEVRTQDQDGFFISMHENSPRRQKTQISSDQKTKSDTETIGRIDKNEDSVITESRQTDVTNVTVENSYDSSVIADFAQKIADKPLKHDRTKESQSDTSQSDTSQTRQEETGSGIEDTTGVGFVIGQDESMLDQSAELEMQKKKDKILQMRLRRQEEQELKRQKKEQELQKKREAERLKQEESERRKSEEKARREQIFQHYLEKKEEDEDGGSKKREEKPKQKPRPKSMFVRAGPGTKLEEGLENSASTEDLSARALTIPAGGTNSTAYFLSPDPVRRNRSKGPRSKHPPSPSRTMRKAVSCNMLDQKPPGGDGKSLAFGGLTHRRPPSPDLYRIRKGQRSNESSESGSATGVPVGADYTGPKLFVKPSAKSNRHIIINAISHCCLAGSVNTDQKNKVLEEIAKSNAKHFLILFRDGSCGYRGLYGFDPDTEDIIKLVGVGPRQITNNMIEKYYKYNSGAKSFSVVSSTKHVSVSIDALVLQNTVWKPAKPPAKGYR